MEKNQINKEELEKVSGGAKISGRAGKIYEKAEKIAMVTAYGGPDPRRHTILDEIKRKQRNSPIKPLVKSVDSEDEKEKSEEK